MKLENLINESQINNNLVRGVLNKLSPDDLFNLITALGHNATIWKGDKTLLIDYIITLLNNRSW